MKETFEAWMEVDSDGSEDMMLAPPDVIREMTDKGLLSRDAKLKFRIEADTFEEACTVQHIKMGWSPYQPVGEATACPNLCGALYYPEGSGECPNCGKVPFARRR